MIRDRVQGAVKQEEKRGDQLEGKSTTEGSAKERCEQPWLAHRCGTRSPYSFRKENEPTGLPKNAILLGEQLGKSIEPSRIDNFC